MDIPMSGFVSVDQLVDELLRGQEHGFIFFLTINVNFFNHN